MHILYLDESGEPRNMQDPKSNPSKQGLKRLIQGHAEKEQ